MPARTRHGIYEPDSLSGTVAIWAWGWLCENCELKARLQDLADPSYKAAKAKGLLVGPPWATIDGVRKGHPPTRARDRH